MARPKRPSRETGRESPYTLRRSTILARPSPYEPIDSENGEIRLVELQPGHLNETINMRLIPTNLSSFTNKPTSYEALSYVWGTKDVSPNAILDNVLVKITANLDCALRQLRCTSEKRLLWIDALAMNQKDLQERNHQVQIMGRIFATAHSVIVWLGPVDNNDLHTRVVLEAMQLHFSSLDPKSETPGTLFESMCSICSTMNEKAGVAEDAKDRVLDVLRDIVTRPWFKRIWVVQELALAQSARIRIGPYSFPWTPFQNFMQWLSQHVLNGKSRVDLVKAAALVTKASRDGLFTEQFFLTSHLSATDLRDKVFGILAISIFRDKAILPDYTKPVDKVFSEAAAVLLQQDAVALYIQAPLYPLHEDPTMLSIPDLPSWVPDFRIAARAYTDDCKFSSVFNSTSIKNECHPDIVLGRPLRFLLEEISARVPFPHVSVSVDCTRITVPGLPIGIVAETLGDLEDVLTLWEEDQRLPQEAIKIFKALFQTHQIRPADVMFALGPYGRRRRIEIHQGMEEDSSAKHCPGTTNHVSTRNTASLEQTISACALLKHKAGRRSVFITRDSHLGSTYQPDLLHRVRPGDHVVGLFGINFPFVLRPREDDTFQMINVAGLVDYEWGHEFLNNNEACHDLQTNSWLREKLNTSPLGEFEGFGMGEYVIT